jgi:hypothetical protein
MRLIDADKLQEDYNEKCAMECSCCTYPIKECEEKYGFPTKFYCGLINEQPTAFNKKVVLEQMTGIQNKCRSSINKSICEECKKIVRKGGAE